MVNLKSIDLIGNTPELLLKSQSRYKTNVGALLTLIVYSCGAALMMYFLVRVFSRSNFVVVASQEFDDRALYDYNGIQQPFLITNSYGYAFDKELEDRMLSIYIEYFYTFKDGSFEQKNFFFKLERCDINKHFPKHREIFEKLPLLDRHYCIPLDAFDFQLYGYYGSNNVYSATMTYVDRCVNGKWGKTNCAAETEIRETLQTMYMQLSFIDYNINNNNIESPGVMYLRSERLPLSTNLFKRFFYEMTPILYKTDLGLIFEDFKEDQFFSVGNFMLQPAVQFGDTYAAYTFSLTRNKTTIVKTLEKLQQVLSNIGGSIKALVVGGTIVNMFFTNNNYHECLINELFDFTEKKEGKKEVKKLRIDKSADSNVHISSFNRQDSQEKKRVSLDKVTFLKNLKMRLFCHTKLQMDLWYKALNILNERMSIESLIRKSVEVDRIKMLLLDERTWPLFSHFNKLKLENTEGMWKEVSKNYSFEQATEEAGKMGMCRNMIEEKLVRYYREMNLI